MSSSHSSSDTKIETVGDYQIQDRIGQGSFATVYKAQHKNTHQTVAVKCVKRSKLTKKLLENLESEISILTAIRHDNIVGLIECQKTDAHVYLVMEYCTMGDLSHYIKEIRSNKSTQGPAGGLPERVVRHFLKQLANALQFLRSQNLIHRDIKPQNLLLTPSNTLNDDDLPVLKIADFGFARFLPNASLADTLCGSPLYMGPEILSYKKYDAKADLWSVGAVLYEMLTGRPPFRAQNHIELLKKIQENNDRIHFPDERRSEIVIGGDLKDLIRKLLKRNPVERLSFEEFFNHPAVVLEEQQHQPIQTRASAQVQRSLSKQTHSQSAHSQHHKTGSYEPPPFAQISSNNLDQRRWSSTTVRNESLDVISQGRRATKFESKEQHHPWTPSSSNLMHSGTKRQGNNKEEEEDMLQEYVVLDLRSIETNQFADELKATPPRSASLNERRLSKSPSSAATSHAVNIPTAATSGTRANISPSSSPFIRERKSSTGSSAGSALAKAISKASVRLFGTSMPSPPKEPHHLVGSPHGFMSSAPDPHHLRQQHEQHDYHDLPAHRTIKRIEDMACMAHAVAKYGDQKYEVLHSSSSISGGGDMKLISEETSALFLKALALIEVGLSAAQRYWSSDLLDIDDEEERKIVASRLYDAVQWMREKFNESLERAESVETDMNASANLNNTAFVDKLLYNRALEMSRAAAVHELVGENITECERDYQTAIWMLEAIYQVRPKGEMTIDENDRLIINKFIDSIRHRITVLRKKMVSERV